MTAEDLSNTEDDNLIIRLQEKCQVIKANIEKVFNILSNPRAMKDDSESILWDLIVLMHTFARIVCQESNKNLADTSFTVSPDEFGSTKVDLEKIFRMQRLFRSELEISDLLLCRIMIIQSIAQKAQFLSSNTCCELFVMTSNLSYEFYMESVSDFDKNSAWVIEPNSVLYSEPYNDMIVSKELYDISKVIAYQLKLAKSENPLIISKVEVEVLDDYKIKHIRDLEKLKYLSELVLTIEDGCLQSSENSYLIYSVVSMLKLTSFEFMIGKHDLNLTRQLITDTVKMIEAQKSLEYLMLNIANSPIMEEDLMKLADIIKEQKKLRTVKIEFYYCRLFENTSITYLIDCIKQSCSLKNTTIYLNKCLRITNKVLDLQLSTNKTKIEIVFTPSTEDPSQNMYI